MAISHADHDHPNTPAARAACRKQIERGTGPLKVQAVDTCPGTPHRKHTRSDDPCPAVKPAKVTVVPRGPKGGVINQLKATKPKAETRRLKVSGTQIKSVGDLADVPATLAGVVRQAWQREWTVQAGHPFTDAERRIVVTAPQAEIALVWDHDGRTAFFVRNWNSSVTFRVTSDDALRAGADADRWTDKGRLVGR